MKTIFLESRYNKKITLPRFEIPGKKIALFTTVQFLDSIKGIKKQLESKGKKVLLLKSKHSKYPGQILGCGVEKVNADSFIYIGDGLFHPKTLLLKNKKPVFAFNPFTKKLRIIEDSEIAIVEKRIKAAYVKFLSSEKIGVLISTKPGQKNMKTAFELERKFKDKKFYFLIFSTLNFSELDNFPFIQCFVNTACRRMAYDDYEKFSKPVIDIEELMRYENEK